MTSTLSLISPKAAGPAASSPADGVAATATAGDSADAPGGFARALQQHTGGHDGAASPAPGERNVAAANERRRALARAIAAEPPATPGLGQGRPGSGLHLKRLIGPPAAAEQPGGPTPLPAVDAAGAADDGKGLSTSPDLASDPNGARLDPLLADPALLAAPAWPDWLPPLPHDAFVAAPNAVLAMPGGPADAPGGAAGIALTADSASNGAVSGSASNVSLPGGVAPEVGRASPPDAHAHAHAALRFMSPGGAIDDDVTLPLDDTIPGDPPPRVTPDDKSVRRSGPELAGPGNLRAGRIDVALAALTEHGQPGAPVPRGATLPGIDGVAHDQLNSGRRDAAASGSPRPRPAHDDMAAAARQDADAGRAMVAAGEASTQLAEAAALAAASPRAEPAAAAVTPVMPGAAPLHSGAPVLASGAAPAALPPQARIDVPIDQPGFAPALGAQLNMLIRDGVHEARLQLHPAEMGPINVQIALDGSAARIEFHAAVAATRDAIEASLPSLASALRESGLTLTGGGVFQQPPGQQPPAHGQSAEGGRRSFGHGASDDASDADRRATAAVGRTLQRRGLVDLVA